MASDVLAVLSEVARELDGLGVRYVVGGSLASGAWGEPRSTHDVDLLVELTEARIAEFSSIAACSALWVAPAATSSRLRPPS